MVRSIDPYHLSCYQFIKEHEDDIHIFPAIAWFEWQASLSRMERAGERILRDLYLLDEKNYVLDINLAFIRKAAELELHLRFATLRGADLIFACAAVIEEATLVTRDKAFLGLDGLRVIIPRTPVDEEGHELDFWAGALIRRGIDMMRHLLYFSPSLPPIVFFTAAHRLIVSAGRRPIAGSPQAQPSRPTAYCEPYSLLSSTSLQGSSGEYRPGGYHARRR
jgi:predicted nucleic acid-binding protein